MAVARITMVEYVSKEAADDFEPKYAEVAPKSIPEADNLILVRTAETSGMSVAIFKDKQTAENALENRKNVRLIPKILLRIIGTCRAQSSLELLSIKN